VESSTVGSAGLNFGGVFACEMVEREMSSRPGAVVSRRWLLRLGRGGLRRLKFNIEGGIAILAAAFSSYHVPVCDPAEMAMPLVGFRSVMPSP